MSTPSNEAIVTLFLEGMPVSDISNRIGMPRRGVEDIIRQGFAGVVRLVCEQAKTSNEAAETLKAMREELEDAMKEDDRSRVAHLVAGLDAKGQVQ